MAKKKKLNEREQAIENRLLIEACVDGDAYRVESLLDAGANPSSFEAEHRCDSALMKALPHGVEIVGLLLSAGAEANYVTIAPYETTVLHQAVYEGAPVVEALLAAGADPAIRDRFGRTALQQAVWAAPRSQTVAGAYDKTVAAAEAMIAFGMPKKVLDDALRTAAVESMDYDDMPQRRWFVPLAKAGADIRAIPKSLDPPLSSKELSAFAHFELEGAVKEPARKGKSKRV